MLLLDVLNMKKDQLWKAALGQLELRVSQGNYLTWFRQAKITEQEGGEVTIETGSPFAHEWLSKKYRDLILEALKNLDQSIQSVRFTVGAAVVQQRSFPKKHLRILVQKHKRQPQPAAASSDSQVLRRLSPTYPGHNAKQAASTFNSKHIFETFITGPSNEIAHAACQAVAKRPGAAYNPLFIYGGVGLGKTHLLQAVGNTVKADDATKRVMYVSAEKFLNDFVEALRENRMPQFRKVYRGTDMLIIDDVQFLAGKGKVQEELFHTFNALHGQNKQVVISCDRPPGAIPTFETRLSSRLGGGMIVDIKKPDYETRLAILTEKAKTRDVKITQEALEFIAKNVQTNVRELEGVLNRVLGHSEVHNQPATLEYTKKVLSDLLDKVHRRTIGSKQILDTVSVYYNLPVEDLCGKCRKKEIVRPRQIAMYLLRKESNVSYPSIGEHFGGRDHTTAMHACEKIEKLLEHDEDLSQEISFLRERLYA